MKKLKTLVIGAVVVCAAVLTVGCDNFFAKPETAAPSNPVSGLTRAEALALMHLEQNHTVSPEALQSQVEAFINSTGEARTLGDGASAITGVRQYNKTFENGFAEGTANSRSAQAEPEASEIPFYVFTLEDPAKETTGFALASGDARVGGVLAVVPKGDYDTAEGVLKVFRSNLDGYVQETIDVYNSVTDTDIEAAKKRWAQIQRSVFDELPAGNPFGYTDYDQPPPHASPLVTTHWGQDTPYNLAITDIFNQEKDVGSEVTALAQILAYHEYLPNPGAYIQIPGGSKKYGFADEEGYYPFSSIAYDWAGMKSMPNAGNLSSFDNKVQIAALMFHVGSLLGKNWLNSNTVPFDNIWNTLYNLGYQFFPYTDYSYNPYLPLTDPDNAFTYIKNSIDAFRPVFIATSEEYDEASGGYWAWLIDNYCIKTGASTLLFPKAYVHINTGEVRNVGWYLCGVLNLNSGPLISTVSDSELDVWGHSGSYYYYYNSKMLAGINHP